MQTQIKNGTVTKATAPAQQKIGERSSEPKPTTSGSKSKVTNTLNEALCEFQKLNISAQKDGNNPFFNNSKYAKLEGVIDAVNHGADFGLSFTQCVKYNIVKLTKTDGSETMARDIYVETTLYHSKDTETRVSIVPVLIANGENKQGVKHSQNPQSMGSGITYAKRYGLQAIYGLATDDDGNAASGKDDKDVNSWGRD